MRNLLNAYDGLYKAIRKFDSDFRKPFLGVVAVSDGYAIFIPVDTDSELVIYGKINENNGIGEFNGTIEILGEKINVEELK